VVRVRVHRRAGRGVLVNVRHGSRIDILVHVRASGCVVIVVRHRTRIDVLVNVRVRRRTGRRVIVRVGRRIGVGICVCRCAVSRRVIHV
jgi:hypothetical protein